MRKREALMSGGVSGAEQSDEASLVDVVDAEVFIVQHTRGSA